MICVWEQTDGLCMLLLTLVQILGQIKDATWLLQTLCSSDQAYFLFSASPTFKFLPILSPLLASFLQITDPSTFSYPHFHHVLLWSFFLFQIYPLPFLFPNPSWYFPYHYHTFTTCQEDFGLCGFCPALGTVQLRLHWAGCRFGLWSRPGPTVRKWPLLWFKLAMRQRNTAFCWRFIEERAEKVGRESAWPSANHMKASGNWFKALPN